MRVVTMFVVTDANYCTATNSFTLAQPSQLNASTSAIVNVNCFGDQNGQASIIASGGTVFLPVFVDSFGAHYIFRKRIEFRRLTRFRSQMRMDAHKMFPVNISQPVQLVSNAVNANVSCNGGNNGSVSLNVNGGTTPYSYAWNPSGSTSSLSNLSVGTYSVPSLTITDAQLLRRPTITEPTSLLAQPTIVNTACGLANGSASVHVFGGTGPYSYLWTPEIKLLLRSRFNRRLLQCTDHRCESLYLFDFARRFKTSVDPVANVATSVDANCKWR